METIQTLPQREVSILMQQQKRIEQIRQEEQIKVLPAQTDIKKLINNEIEKILSQEQPKKNYIITQETLKKVAFKKFNREFVIDKTNFELVKNLIDYFNNKTHNDKGILFCGTIGIGKTLLMNIFQFITTAFNFENKFTIFRANGIIEKFGAGGNEWYNDFLYMTDDIDIMIDDLGTEDKEVLNYGNRVDIMTKFLSYRYDLWQIKGKLTHITSNLRYLENDFKARYGERVGDRFNEMFNYFSLVGESRRGKK